MLKFFFQLFVILLFFTCSSYAQKFKNILINGNKRISNETILVFSDLPQEKFLNQNSLNIILKKLYKSGYFSDVIIKIEQNNLIIEVVENPIIQSVFIEGIQRKKTLEELYKILSLKNRSSFNTTSAKNDEVKILNVLKNKGYFFSTITSSYEDLGDNKIDLLYKI